MSEYYLKFNVVEKKFALDTVFRAENDYYAIKNAPLTEAQAEEFVARIERKYISQSKPFEMNLLEAEFNLHFKICSECKVVITRKKWLKHHGSKCAACYSEVKGEIIAKKRRKVVAEKRTEALKEYVSTEQGVIDTVGAQMIFNNIKVQLLKKNKTQTELAELLEMSSPSSVTRMFHGNKSITADRLFKIAEWLRVPFDVLVKLPRGVKVEKKNGVPVNVTKIKKPTN
jgi:plasmid maintenance system antidote protein VapI